MMRSELFLDISNIDTVPDRVHCNWGVRSGVFGARAPKTSLAECRGAR
jgi:hypothetical protein